MPRIVTLGAIGVCVASIVLVAEPSSPLAGTAADVDAVVLDTHGRPVRGLRQEDFRIVEDGRPAAVTDVSEVTASGIGGAADARSVVLLLGNTDSRSQVVARVFASRARPGDRVTVIRMTHPDDEVTGDLGEALRRIDEPQRFSIVQGRSRLEDLLETVARVSKELEPLGRRHTVLVCIADRGLCDIYLGAVEEQSRLWPHWTKALSAAARAHVSVFYVDPTGLTASMGQDLGDGLVEHTGGETFFNSNNYQRMADRVWDEAGHYYLLTYLPVGRPMELHSVDVTVTRPGLHVRARRSRSEF